MLVEIRLALAKYTIVTMVPSSVTGFGAHSISTAFDCSAFCIQSILGSLLRNAFHPVVVDSKSDA